LEELRAAGADERKRVEAERSFTQGLGEARTNAFDRAILLYTRALGLYREVKDHEREGDTLRAAGQTPIWRSTTISVRESGLKTEPEFL